MCGVHLYYNIIRVSITIPILLPRAVSQACCGCLHQLSVLLAGNPTTASSSCGQPYKDRSFKLFVRHCCKEHCLECILSVAEMVQFKTRLYEQMRKGQAQQESKQEGLEGDISKFLIPSRVSSCRSTTPRRSCPWNECGVSCPRISIISSATQ